MIAVQALKAADPQREIIIVRRPGWHVVPGAADSIFICPDGTVIGAPGKVAAKMIYTIASSTGKRRMNADATIRMVVTDNKPLSPPRPLPRPTAA
jgi:hypothetical protein